MNMPGNATRSDIAEQKKCRHTEGAGIYIIAPGPTAGAGLPLPGYRYRVTVISLEFFTPSAVMVTM
jgi:hypothetical protein